jgi:hypothetical protein
MGDGIRSVSATERRARLATRHHLAPWARAETVTEAAAGLIALHGSDPASVYLAAWARTQAVDHARIGHALYAERSLVRMLGMRRTMFVIPVELAPLIQAACTDQIAERLRRDLVAVIQQAGIQQAGIDQDAAGWLDEVGQAAVRALAARDGAGATGAELAAAEPRLRTQVVVAEGKSYGGPVSLTSRILMLLSAEGQIFRGRPRGGWTSSQYEWFAAETWLPAQSASKTIAPAAARAELARRWLHTFGPAPATDLRWWTGWTVGQMKAALSQLRTIEVDLDGSTGLLLTDDDEYPTVDREPWAALLPALDPTAMGWRDRNWYLGEHAPVLFDRSGNIGPTIWWNGRIVGGWAQRRDGDIVIRLLEDIGTDAAAAVAAEAGRLREWIGPVRITPRFRTPLERELSG